MTFDAECLHYLQNLEILEKWRNYQKVTEFQNFNKKIWKRQEIRKDFRV